MKSWLVKITSILLLTSFLITGCAEPRYYERDRDDRGRRHHTDHHDHDDDHHDDDHHDHH